MVSPWLGARRRGPGGRFGGQPQQRSLLAAHPLRQSHQPPLGRIHLAHRVLGMRRGHEDPLPDAILGDRGADPLDAAGQRVAHGPLRHFLVLDVTPEQLRPAADQRRLGAHQHLPLGDLGDRGLLQPDVAEALRLDDADHDHASRCRNSGSGSPLWVTAWHRRRCNCAWRVAAARRPNRLPSCSSSSRLSNSRRNGSSGPTQ